MTAMADGLDALSGPAFETLYEGRIRPELESFEARRAHAANIFFGLVAGGLVLCVLEVLANLHPGVLGVTLVGAVMAGYIPLANLAKAAKCAVIEALCAPLGMTYQADGFEPPGWDKLRALRLLPGSDAKTVEDLFTGHRGDCAFSICEAKLTQGSGKEQETVFSGQLIRVTTPRGFAGATVILRDSGWLNRFQCPPGLKKVGLEDPHFEKVFEAFGDDQVEARVLLHPVFMEQLLSLEKAFAGRHIRCGFAGGEFLIAVEGPNRFEIGGMFSSLVNRSRVDAMAADIRTVIALIDVFAQARP